MQELLFTKPSYLSPITYVGSKKKLYRLLIAGVLGGIPAEVVSPFMGGCSLELRLAANGTRVHAYDIFLPLVEFHQMFNGRSREVIAKTLEIYPLAREVYEHMRTGFGWEEVECPIHRAAITWSISKQCFMGRNFSSTPVSDKNATTIGVFQQPEWDGWYNENITFAQADFRDSLAAHPSALAYMDPPYVSKEDYYGRGDQGEFPHVELRDILAERDNWVLSYGDDDKGLIRELYADYDYLKPEWGYGFGKAAGKPENSSELLILSHDIAHRRKTRC